jgi:hypothetical protein
LAPIQLTEQRNVTFVGQFLDNRRPVVGRAIVNHDELIGLDRLCENAADRPPDPSGTIKQRNDRDDRPVSHPRLFPPRASLDL